MRKAYGGEDGIYMAMESQPDLIILDLMMPGTDGFEVIRHLKKFPKTKDIPIIIASSKRLNQEETVFLNDNIEKIVRKGKFKKEDLLEGVKSTLNKIKG